MSAKPPLLDVPDLVLDDAPKRTSTPPVSRQQSIPAGPPTSDDFALTPRSGQRPSAAPRAPTGEVDLLLDSGGDLDFGFELETSIAPEPKAASVPPRRSSSGTHSAQALTGGLTRDSAAPRPWPKGVTPHADDLQIDPLEIAIVADYGQAPASFALTPLYALRVFQRQRELKALTATAEASLVAAESRRDDLLLAFVDHCRPALGGNDRCRNLLVEIERSETLAAERQSALGKASAELEGTTAGLDARLSALEAERSVAERRRQEAATVLERAEEMFRRHEAQTKRVEIERRSVLDVARQKLGPAGGAIPPDLASKLAELDARAASLAPEGALLLTERDRARQSLSGVEVELTNNQRIARQVEDDKRSFTTRQRGELQLRADGLTEAQRARREALTLVAQRILETRGELFSVDKARLDGIHAADDAVRAALLHATKLRRALTAYDREAAKKGRVALAGVALFVLFLILAVVLG